jgi:ABC-type glycerol-3-phosphate transport system substrate-binding protein
MKPYPSNKLTEAIAMRGKAFICCLLMLALINLGYATIAYAAKTVVEYLHDPDNGETWRQWLRTAEAKFEAENPDIDVQIIILTDRNEMLTKIPVLFASGMLSDVVETGPSEGTVFVEQGIFQDLNPFMKAERDFSWDDIFPTLMPAITSEDGKRCFLPISVWVIGGVFNLDYFAESGVVAPTQLGRPWTWDDFRQMSRKLVRDDANGNPIRYAAEVARA